MNNWQSSPMFNAWMSRQLPWQQRQPWQPQTAQSPLAGGNMPVPPQQQPTSGMAQVMPNVTGGMTVDVEGGPVSGNVAMPQPLGGMTIGSNMREGALRKLGVYQDRGMSPQQAPAWPGNTNRWQGV